MELTDAPALLTVAETAELLRVDTRTIHRHLKLGTLRGYKVLGEWRIPREAIVERLTTAEEEQ